MKYTISDDLPENMTLDVDRDNHTVSIPNICLYYVNRLNNGDDKAFWNYLKARDKMHKILKKLSKEKKDERARQDN